MAKANPQARDETRPEAAERTYDAIVIGGGHNGLVNGVPGQSRPADLIPSVAIWSVPRSPELWASGSRRSVP
jgi:hypothetical protein